MPAVIDIEGTILLAPLVHKSRKRGLTSMFAYLLTSMHRPVSPVWNYLTRGY